MHPPLTPTLLSEKFIQKDILKAVESALAYLEFTSEGTILSANKNYLTISGYTIKELVGKNFKCLWTGKDLISQSYADFWDKLKEGKVIKGTFRKQRKSGEIFWVEAVYCPLSSKMGETDKVIAFCIDVTQNIERSKEKKRHLEAVDRSFIVASYSPEGVLLEGNENFISTLGYPEQDLSGKRLELMFSPEAASPEDFKKFWELIRAGHCSSGRMLWPVKNASPVWLYSTFTPMFNASGSVDKVIQIAWDITHIANKENENCNYLRMFHNIIDLARSAVAISDAGNKTVYANKAYTSMFGYEEEEILGKFPTSIFGPGEKRFLHDMRKRLSTEQHYTGEDIAYCKNGQRLWISTQVSSIFDPSGRREYLVNIFTDVTELKLNEILQSKTLEGLASDMPSGQLLELLCAEIERIMPGLHVGIIGINNQNKVVPLTSPLQTPKQQKKPRPQEGCAYSGSNLDEPSSQAQIPAKLKHLFASLNVNICMAAVVKNTSGKVIGAIGFYQEECTNNHVLPWLADIMSRLCAIIMERDENHNKMRQLTYYDPITGLPNRNSLVSGAESLFSARFPPDKDTSFAVMYINVDRFSRINHSYGYNQGNDILRAVAEKIVNLKGKQDIVGSMSADEFVLIAPHCDAGQAFEKAKRIQDGLAKPFAINDIDLSLTSSIGISLCPNNGSCLSSLINAASNSLLQNKRKGTGKISFFSDDLNALAKNSLSLETNLRNAVENKNLALYYQPQVYLCSGKIYGVEALCRWNDKKCGFVPPEQFIPLAEQTGLIEKLSDWVLHETCRQLADWRDKGLEVPSVSINLSSSNFHDSNLPDKIITHLHNFGLNASDIILELTESVLLDENPTTLATIERAHQLGFALSLDDFGTGYSSLSYLRNLPFSEIKLDQSFVRDLHTTEVSRRLSEAVMGLGRSLKLTVLAEGVENMEQYRLLKQQNCHVAQGYLLSKPLPPQDLEKWIQAWHPRTMADQHSLL